MCKHSSFLTTEQCVDCQDIQELEPVHAAPIYSGLSRLDREAERLGRHTKGFKFCNVSRRGARGGRRSRIARSE